MPSQEEIDRISPLHELEVGQYKTPTFLIHGDEDRLAPLESSEQFISLCKKRGIKAGLHVVEGAIHNSHDLWLKFGSEAWQEGVQPGYDFLLDLLK